MSIATILEMFPKLGDKAFSEAIEGTFVDLPDGCMKFLSRATGFKCAGDLLVEAIDAGTTGGENPANLFPVVSYLYRHYLELGLKDAVRQFAELGYYKGSDLSDAQKLLEKHGLTGLYRLANKPIANLWNNEIERFQFIESIIKEFDGFDQDGQTFRYDRKKNGVLNEFDGMPQRLDMRNLRSKIDQVGKYLTFIYLLPMCADVSPIVRKRMIEGPPAPNQP